MGRRLGDFWSELRSRRVVGAAAAYLAVSFVLLQLGEILFPAFDLGPSAMRALFALLLALFPVTLALSWVYDVTSTGLERTDDGPAGSRSERTLAAVALLTSVAIGWAGWHFVRAIDPAEIWDAGEGSIAVLPFVDLSASQDQAYLGDGLAEEVLNLLAGVPDVQVAARTSSFAFREAIDIREIGRELAVATVLEGSVRRTPDAIRVTAQLIDTESGYHLWSQNFDRDAGDVLALQDDLAAEIATRLLSELGIEADLGARYVASPEAQDAYWRGRAQWSRRDATGIPEAIELFNRAIAADSSYAEAYAGLADSWALLPQFVPSTDAVAALERAEALARRAIDLDPDLAEPHGSLGLVLALRRDRVGALGELGRAITLNPSYAPALHWRANVLAEMGRLREARADAERAADVDPLSPAIATDLANILLWSGDFEGARLEFERARSLSFGHAPAALGLALVALYDGESLAPPSLLGQWAALSGAPASLGGQLATGMAAFLERGEEQAVPESLIALGESGRLPAGTVAALAGLLGARDIALAWVRRSVEDGSWVDQYFRVNPAYDDLRPDPEFRAILNELGA